MLKQLAIFLRVTHQWVLLNHKRKNLQKTHISTKIKCYQNNNVSHLMKNTHTDKPNYTPTGTHTHLITHWHTPLHPWKPNYTLRGQGKKMETHTAWATCTQLYSTHTYIKLSINGHSRVLLIQSTIALSLLHWPFLRLSISPLSSHSPPRSLFFSMYWWLLLPWGCCKSVGVAGVGLGSRSPLDHPLYVS